MVVRETFEENTKVNEDDETSNMITALAGSVDDYVLRIKLEEDTDPEAYTNFVSTKN